jgi:hypothetical protein
MNANDRKDDLRGFLLSKAREPEELPAARVVLWEDCARILGEPDTPRIREIVRRVRKGLGIENTEPIRSETGTVVGFTLPKPSTILAVTQAKMGRTKNHIKRRAEEVVDASRMPGLKTSVAQQIGGYAAVLTMVAEAINPQKPTKVLPFRLAPKAS